MTTRSAASRNRRWFILILTFLLFFGVVYGDGGSLGSSPPDKGVDDALFDKAFRPSMAVIVMVLISALFFIGFFSIYLRHCATELGSNTPASPRFGFSLRPAQRGMEPAVIESLPTFVYSAVKGMKIGKGGTECAVCLSEFDDGDTIRLLPKCSHAFHTDCIDVWLSSHVTCPLCRANLLETVPSGGDARVVAIEIVESHLANDSGNQVVIPVADEEVDPISRIESLHVPAASTSLRIPAKGRVKSLRKFPRSHSTGHSIVPVESLERFTIKLPENLQRKLLAGRMQPVDGGGSESGFKASEGSSPWTFSITPPFIQRPVSSIPSRSVESERVYESAVDKHSLPLPFPV